MENDERIKATVFQKYCHLEDEELYTKATWDAMMQDIICLVRTDEKSKRERREE